ncbi:hypothetical protein SAMN05216474_0370 [Lishizhenia tianjinensis]|uniref:Uncharacterized protein n=1 Tax=Lishizhenia tianjinensis TaxID=477690 RepID=A0A1I6XR29_9FLAO|nr:hypothetical protein [Lishizhenia tianjinensis]SFT40361.1 hypothetical protein SAMN05216474_0370 [Lishizhenia tianjinensis]
MSKRRNTLIVWVAIYPAITLLTYLIGNDIKHLPIYIRTLILTGVLVPSMIYFLIPFWAKIINKIPSRKHPRTKA